MKALGTTSAGTAKTLSQSLMGDAMRFHGLRGVFFSPEDDPAHPKEEPKETPKEEPKTEEKLIPQSELDRLIGKVREEEKAKFDKKLREDKEKAEKAKAEEQGKFKELYDEAKRKEETEYTPALQKLSAYEQRINSLLEAEIKDWDSDLLTQDPGADNVEARSAWVEKSRALAKKLALKTNVHHEHSDKDAKKTTANTAESYKDKMYPKKKA